MANTHRRLKRKRPVPMPLEKVKYNYTLYSSKRPGPGRSIAGLAQDIKRGSKEPCIPVTVLKYISAQKSYSPISAVYIEDDEFGDDPPGWTSFDLQREFHDVYDIVRAAALCHHRKKSEDSWRAEVVGPLLQLAFRSAGRSTVAVESMSSASLIPGMAPGPPGVLMPSTAPMMGYPMVDFAITAASVNLEQRTVQLLMHPAVPEHIKTANQTMHPHVRFQPIGMSVVVRKGVPTEQNRIGQLPAWTGAWYRRIALLIRTRLGVIDDEEMPDFSLIPLPVLVFREHLAELHFAVFHPATYAANGDQSSPDTVEFAMYPHRIGDFKSVENCYLLLKTLRRIGTWVETDFVAWWESQVLNNTAK